MVRSATHVRQDGSFLVAAGINRGAINDTAEILVDPDMIINTFITIATPEKIDEDIDMLLTLKPGENYYFFPKKQTDK